jgi:hypothetical protein
VFRWNVSARAGVQVGSGEGPRRREEDGQVHRAQHDRRLKDSQLRAAKVLRAVSDAYELPEAGGARRLFDYGRRKMVERWRMLRGAAAASGIFSLPEETSAFCNFTREMAVTNPGM